MELKKSKESNLENKRNIFLTIGMVISSSLILMAFNYKTVNDISSENTISSNRNVLSDEIIYEIQEIEKIPEPIQKIVPNLENIKIVEDDEIVPEIDLTIIEEDDLIIESDSTNQIIEEDLIEIPDIEPSFPGGEVEMYKWIYDNITYPEMSIQMGEQGIVYVEFTVNKNGSIEDISVLSSPSELLKKESIRMIKNMPVWIPGEKMGKKVRSKFILPIEFSIK